MKIKSKVYIILSLVFFSFCKDPIYNKCDQLCNVTHQCVKEQIQQLNHISQLDQKKWENFLYTNCMDACMIYNQEIFECFNENEVMLENVKSLNDTQICSKIMNCVLPIFLNQ